MKRISVIIIALILLISLTSCEHKDYMCYYGYFSDTAFATIYSSSKNTLYYVDLPLDVLFKWGTIKNIDSVPAVINDFAGLNADGFMLGNRQTLEALRDILDTMSDTEKHNVESRLNTAVKRSSVFLNRSLLTQMSQLCSCDLTLFVKTIAQTHPDVRVMDASVVLDSEMIDFSHDYFQTWINQMIK